MSLQNVMSKMWAKQTMHAVHQTDKNRWKKRNCTQVPQQKLIQITLFLNHWHTVKSTQSMLHGAGAAGNWHLGNIVAWGEWCNYSVVKNEVKLGENITRRSGGAWHLSWHSKSPVFCSLKAECFVSQHWCLTGKCWINNECHKLGDVWCCSGTKWNV